MELILLFTALFIVLAVKEYRANVELVNQERPITGFTRVLAAGHAKHYQRAVNGTRSQWVWMVTTPRYPNGKLYITYAKPSFYGEVRTPNYTRICIGRF